MTFHALRAGNAEVLASGLKDPVVIAVADGMLYIVDAGTKQVVVDLKTNARTTIAWGLPVGPPPGFQRKPFKGMPPFSGPQGPFAGIAVGADGTVFVSADGEGSVPSLRRI